VKDSPRPPRRTFLARTSVLLVVDRALARQRQRPIAPTPPLSGIQQDWDESVPLDVVALLRKLVPRGVWLHDAQDGNGDAHPKAELVGPSETVPTIEGRGAVDVAGDVLLRVQRPLEVAGRIHRSGRKSR
jgi:hypothetical protein